MADDAHGTELAGRDTRHSDAGQPDDIVDELPADLQPALAGGDYVFPNNNRRRIPAVLYVLFALTAAAVYLFVDSPAVNGGWLGAAILLGAFGAYAWVAGANLNIDERDALVAAAADAGFPAGHASAQLGWRGLLCRPTWRVLLYSAEEPPLQRGLLFVDGIDGRVIERIIEDNPEDWSELQPGRDEPSSSDATRERRAVVGDHAVADRVVAA